MLVTGASKGIGAACVRRLDARGFRVFACVRSEHDAEQLRRDASPRLRTIQLDVTDAGMIAAAAAEVGQALDGEGLAGLVNNAGIAIAGPLEFLPIAALRRQLEVNVIGQLATTQAFLPLLRPARGRIIFISSIAGRSALPFAGAYSASKFALEAAADALRVELRPWGLRVVLIEPGVVETPIWDTALAEGRRNRDALPSAGREYYGATLAALERGALGGLRGMSAAAVAAVIERALVARRPKRRYVLGAGARSRLWLERLPTALRDAVVAAGVRRISGSARTRR